MFVCLACGNYLLWIWYGSRGCTCLPYNVCAIWTIITQIAETWIIV